MKYYIICRFVSSIEACCSGDADWAFLRNFGDVWEFSFEGAVSRVKNVDSLLVQYKILTEEERGRSEEVPYYVMARGGFGPFICFKLEKFYTLTREEAVELIEKIRRSSYRYKILKEVEIK